MCVYPGTVHPYGIRLPRIIKEKFPIQPPLPYTYYTLTNHATCDRQHIARYNRMTINHNVKTQLVTHAKFIQSESVSFDLPAILGSCSRRSTHNLVQLARQTVPIKEMREHKTVYSTCVVCVHAWCAWCSRCACGSGCYSKTELRSCSSSSSHCEEACNSSYPYNCCCSEELASQTVWGLLLLSLAVQSFVGKLNECFLQEQKATADNISGAQKHQTNREITTTTTTNVIRNNKQL